MYCPVSHYALVLNLYIFFKKRYYVLGVCGGVADNFARSRGGRG